MTYADTTITPATGYTNVHAKQCYDAVASVLTAKGAPWSFVESVDYVSGTTTWTTYVWKCAASGSGLSADFYVAFQVKQVSGLYVTADGFRVLLFETYSAATHTAGKIAQSGNTTTVTIAADGTSPNTWITNTNLPQSGSNSPMAVGTGPSGSVATSYRMLILVASDAIIIWGQASGGTLYPVYAGAIDTVLSSADDPLPLLLQGGGNQHAASQGWSPTYGYGASTRMPKLAGQTLGVVFGIFATSTFHATNHPSSWSTGGLLNRTTYTTQSGSLGNPGDTNADLYQGGGVPVSRICISTCGNQVNAANRGGHRGFMRHMVSVSCAVHSMGDTFTIDGATWVGSGTGGMTTPQYGLMDTSA